MDKKWIRIYICISIESITLNRFSYVYIASIILREVIKIFEIFETNREHTSKADREQGKSTFKKS